MILSPKMLTRPLSRLKKYLIKYDEIQAFIFFIKFEYFSLLKNIIDKVEFGTI